MEHGNDDYVRFGLVVLRAMREDAGLSQTALAEKLGITKTTVANWECGKTCPDAVETWEWYQACGGNPVPYIMEWRHPARYSSKEEFDTALLLRSVELMPVDEQRLLLYAIAGNHGGSWGAIINLVAAHVHLPMKARLIHGDMVYRHYQVAQEIGTVRHTDRPLPDLEKLKKGIDLGFEAVKNGEESYSIYD